MTNRVGYNLPELPKPANEPIWARDLTVATQAVMDAQYLHGEGGLDNFYGQAEQWIQTGTAMRTNASDPKSFVPDKFKMSIPRRQLVAYDINGNMLPDVWAEVDPNIHFPILPAYVDPGPVGGAGFKSTPLPDPAIAQQQNTQMMAAVMAKLVSIEQRLIALLAK